MYPLPWLPDMYIIYLYSFASNILVTLVIWLCQTVLLTHPGYQASWLPWLFGPDDIPLPWLPGM